MTATMIPFQPPQLPGYFFLFALCVLCPLQWLSVSRSSWFREPPKHVGDGPDYENIAFHLWQGSGFVIDSTDSPWRAPYERSVHNYTVHLESTPRSLPTTGRPPLFPMVVAAIYGLFGRNEWGFAAVRLFSATCLAVAGALAVRLTAELLVNQVQRACRAEASTGDAATAVPREASLAERQATLLTAVTASGAVATLLLIAINRTLREYATDFLTEPLALLLMQCFVLLACRASASVCTHTSAAALSVVSLGDSSLGATSRLANKRLWGASLVAGIVWGGLILTRSMFVVWLPAVWLLFVLAVPQALATRLKVATLVVVMACLVCAPWWVRNCIVLQRWMPLGTQGPTTLLGGYSDEALQGNGDWQAAPELQLRRELSQRPEFQALADESAREVAVAQAASRRVRSWIWAHLADLPQLVARRIYVHWNPYSGASLLWKIPLIAGAVGLLMLRSRAAYWLLGLPLTSTVVVATFYSTGGRFLVPLYGLLFSLAGLGVAYAVVVALCGLDGGSWRFRGAIDENCQDGSDQQTYQNK